MPKVHVLDQSTINQIAAGEVIERPSSVVKELTENALDAGATAITVEIREGGLGMIRVTDNGCGIDPEDVTVAFLPHATSKITSATDLLSVSSLGFRGEALASIAAVSRVELITKTENSLTGIRYCIEGGKDRKPEEIGAPDGTTFIVRELFFNTPARRKFLKTPTTEGAYVSALIERLALSRPDVSFRLIINNQTKLHTSGNHKLKDMIYTIYGRDISRELIPLKSETESIKIRGFAGKPEINRGNRTYENYFINGRYVKSNIIIKAIENAYHGYVMQHKYPFVVFHMDVDPSWLDVNVHPTKMELRFRNEEEVYETVFTCVRSALEGRELIPRHAFEDAAKGDIRKTETKRGPEPFEERRGAKEASLIRESASFGKGADRSWPERPGQSGKSADLKTSGLGREYVSYGKPLTSAPSPQPASKLPASSKDERPAYEPSTIERIQQSQRNSLLANLKIQQELKEQDGGIKPVETSDKALKIGGQAVETGDKAVETGDKAVETGDKTLVTDVQALAADSTALPDAMAQNDNEEDSAKETARLTESSWSAEEIKDVRQMELFEDRLLTRESRAEYRLIGQLFNTYWLIQYKEELLIMDQHAAHEKVLFERSLIAYDAKEATSQELQPPLILTLNAREELALAKMEKELSAFGFRIEPFGGREHAVYAVPGNLYELAQTDILMEMIDLLADETADTHTDILRDKLALMSCKAAVKGNHRLSFEEANALLDELLTLKNPYMCPHGRPTIITMSRYELEKKFKRVVE